MSEAITSPALVRAEDVDGHDGVRLLTLDRPQALNAFDSPLYRAKGAALDAARADDAVKVVVITRAGRAFSAGQDLDEMARLAAGEQVDSGFPVLLDALQAFDKPLVAAVNGAAVGIGFTMLPHYDLVLAADTARFRTPFAEMGVPPKPRAATCSPHVWAGSGPPRCCSPARGSARPRPWRAASPCGWCPPTTCWTRRSRWPRRSPPHRWPPSGHQGDHARRPRRRRCCRPRPGGSSVRTGPGHGLIRQVGRTG